MSDAQKLKQSLAMRGRPSSFKGKKHTVEAKHKIGIKSMGRKHNLGRKRKDLAFLNTLLKTGTTASPESNLKRRLALVGKRTGSENPAWRGGVTPIHKAIRASRSYKRWRKAVFERDNYVCVECKVRGVELQADHIKSFSAYPELRLELSNGRTLCVPCHKLTPTYARNLG